MNYFTSHKIKYYVSCERLGETIFGRKRSLNYPTANWL